MKKDAEEERRTRDRDTQSQPSKANMCAVQGCETPVRKTWKCSVQAASGSGFAGKHAVCNLHYMRLTKEMKKPNKKTRCGNVLVDCK